MNASDATPARPTGLFRKNESGIWEVGERPHGLGSLDPLILENLSAFDRAFSAAKSRREYDFVLALMRFRPDLVPDWDPFLSTFEVFPQVAQAITRIEAPLPRWHVSIWLYLHIMEAAEPYEILRNILEIGSGNAFQPIDIAVDTKTSVIVRRLEKTCVRTGHADTFDPIRKAWNLELRNAVAHAAYVIADGDLRIFRPRPHVFIGPEVQAYIDAALAYFLAFVHVLYFHIAQYRRSIEVKAPRSAMAIGPASIVVRQGYGAIGIKYRYQGKAGTPARRMKIVNISRDDRDLLWDNWDVVELVGLEQYLNPYW